MVITVPSGARPHGGLRPINLNKDIPQVMRLLELVFGRRLGPEGHRILSGSVGLDRPAAFLWRLSPGASRLAMGYVWEENGRIIGNATVLNTKVTGRFLVVNVAVHPDYRRRGIAHDLMDTVIDLVQERQGSEILLQVEKQNTAGFHLYKSLGFESLGSMTTWMATHSTIRDIDPVTGDIPGPVVRELGRREWQAAYELDLVALNPDLNWPDALSPDLYRGGLWRWFNTLFNGRNAEVWVVAEASHQLRGLAGIWSEWMRPHRINMRVLPHWRGRLERPLLAKIIRRLRHLPRRDVRLVHPDEDQVMNLLLGEANFRRRRTLTHMRLAL